MKTRFKIYRFDPERDKKSRFQEYELKTQPTDKILDCLNRIRWEQDPTLAFRMSCGHGVCGSDGMRINSVCAISCQRLVKDYGEGTIIVEPLPNFPVAKDLVVDMDSFFTKYRNVNPFLIPGSKIPEKERRQSQEQRKKFDEAIRCILCASCTAACPVIDENEKFLGPAALLRAFRYLFDSRDEGLELRREALDSEEGIWGCETHGKCTEVCPKEIPVTRSLAMVKLQIKGKIL
jgi:succinate dehydrogenase / fumarate reductase iron-sulfur subunit